MPVARAIVPQCGLLARVTLAHLGLNLLVLTPILVWMGDAESGSAGHRYLQNALGVLRMLNLPGMAAALLLLFVCWPRLEQDRRGNGLLAAGVVAATLSYAALVSASLDGVPRELVVITVAFQMTAAVLAHQLRHLPALQVAPVDSAADPA